MKHKLSLFAVLLMALAIPQSVKAYDFSKAYQGQMLYYTVIDSVNHYVMLIHPKDTLSGDEQWSIMNSGTALWDTNNRPFGALVLPDTVSHDGIIYTVRAIGAYTFADCPIYSVVMSNTIDSLGDAVFLKCTSLTHVTFSNSLRYVGIDAFYATHLGNVVLPSSVRILKDRAFEDAGITSITLNDSLEVMEGGCFANNWSESRDFYNTFTTLNIPASVRSFMGDLTSVTSITVDPNNPYYDSRNNCNAVINSNTDELIYGCRNTIIPSDIVILGNEAFRGCGPFDTFVVPNSVLQMHFSDRGPSIRKLIVSSPSMVISMSGNPIDTIKVLADTPPILVINGNAGRVVIEVPCNTLADYQSSSPWNQFTNMHEYGTPQITVNAEHGTATVDAYPTCGNDTATVSANADSNYHFVRWSDGSTQNPYTLVLTGNTTLTAIFAIDSVLVRATPANPLKGAVMGGGVVPLNGTTTLTAIPLGSNIFLTWSNGVTDNPYTLTVNSDTTLQAYFTLPDTLIFRDTINHYIHDTTFVNNYVHDTTIQYVNQYIHDTTYINNYIHDTTILYMNQYVHDTTIVNNYIHDTIRMTTQMFDTTIVNVYHFDTAIYNTYHFDTLIVNNHYYDTVYITTHHYDTIYITEQGIGDVDGINAKVYSNRGQVVVEGANGNMVTLYDVNGRVLATKQDNNMPLRFDAPVSGTYMIKIGNYPARKVVVIR